METTNPLSDRSCLTGCDSGIENYSGTGSAATSISHQTTTNNHVQNNSNHLQSNSEATSALDISDAQEDEGASTGSSDEEFKNDQIVDPNKRISSDSGSTFEIIDNSPQSPTSYQLVEDDDDDDDDDDDSPGAKRKNFPKLELNLPIKLTATTIMTDNRNRHGSQSSTSAKPCEVNIDEERDTFSPISNNGYSSDQPLTDEVYCSTSNSVKRNRPIHSGAENSVDKNFTPTLSIDAHELTLPLSSPLNLSITAAAAVPNSSTVILTNIATTPANIIATSSASNSNSSDLDNKIFEKKKIKSTSTKEEKQRQNEEIVIMETSSVSSETGSWESVFPNRSGPSTVLSSSSNFVETKEACDNFLHLERKNSDEPNATTATVTASCPVSACFIDASTLFDESEMNDIIYPPQLPENGCFGPKPIDGASSTLTITPTQISPKSFPITSTSLIHPSTISEASTSAKTTPEDLQKSEASTSSNSECWKKKMNLDKLESFYKSFELCKSKPLEYHQQDEQRDSNSSSCSSDSPKRTDNGPNTEENTNNLSDEEKLWKRENSKKSRSRIDVKDQYNKESPSDIKIITKAFKTSSDGFETEPSSSSTSEIIDSLPLRQEQGTFEINENEILRIRKDQERKQGNLVFQNNIQQFSGHIINPKIPFLSATATTTTALNCGGNIVPEQHNFIDFSSPVPSLAWSDVDGSNGRCTNYDSSSVFGDTSDFGETSSNFNSTRVHSDSGATSVSCILPDTPHNSIVQIGPNSKVIKDSSLQYHHDEIENPQGIKIPTKKSTRCDDSAPIVSGGASIKDFTPKQCESPTVRRKTETCPIVSGGFVSLDLQRDDDLETSIENKNRNKPKFKQQTWVVDMSDCFSPNNGKRRRSTSSSSSTENTARSVDASFEHTNSTHSQRNGLGFYVSLNDMEPPKSIDSDYSSGTTCASSNVSRKLSRSLHDNAKKSTGFYVDLSGSESSRNATPPPSKVDTLNGTPRNNSESDKKNMFSMFIDFGEKKNVQRKEPLSLASRLSCSLNQKKSEDLMKLSGNSQDTLMSGSQDEGIHSQNSLQNEKLDSAGETMILSSDESRKPSLLMTSDTGAEETEQASLIPQAHSMVIRRNTALQKDEIKRHSWNNSERNSSSTNSTRKEHKRSSSLSTSASDKNIMNILDKIPLISKTSSMSIDSSLSPFDDITCSKTDLSTYSNNSITSNSGGENESHDKNSITNAIAKQQKKRRRDVQINETFDKSSQGSITDGVLSKDISPSSNTTDTDELTFQQDENYALLQESPVNGSVPLSTLTNVSSVKDIGRPNIMETIIETKETASPKKSVTKSNPVINQSSTATHTMETLHATIEKQKMLLETVNEHTESNNGGSNFVRLSDLDKPITAAKFELHSPDAIMSKSVGNQRHINRLFQETTRNRPHSWAMTRSTGNNILNITNSVENLRSLSRLFPHLSKEFSNSLPNDVCLEQTSFQNQVITAPSTSATTAMTSAIYQQRTPSELDFINSVDMSTADSSLASSFSRSALDESSISCRQPRRLGEDLLKMFLQEIGTDVTVEVSGRRIKAHKCILRSRCQYFAAMLAGGWVQSAGNVISLQGYSYSAVHFALCHIYSGACHPPDGISLMELAALADLLGLEGLKEVTAHALKSNYCHNFHKPCSGCIDGILQVLPVALNHALDDLYRKCLKWTCRHYLKVWPTRSFAQLPSEIFGRCRQQIVAHLTSETVLQAILECDQLILQLVHCRWAIIIENLLRDILDSAYAYVSEHFSSLIASDSFLSLGHDKSSDITQLENLLLRTASSLNPDQACRSYQRVTRLNAVLSAKIIKMPGNLHETNKTNNNDFGNGVLIVSGTEEEMEWNEEFIRLVSAVLSAVEQCLIRQCSRAMRVTAWQRMDLELRKKIQKLACLTEPLDLRRSGSGTIGTNVTNKQQFSNKQIAFSSGNSRNQDLYQVKLAIQAHSKRALAQDTQLYRATAHTQTHTHDRITQTNEKSIQAVNHQNQDNNRGSSGGYGKIMKTNSRAHVPTNIQPPKVKSTTEKSNHIYGHRRTQSEDSSMSTTAASIKHHETSFTQHNIVKPTTQRLTEIRPRYLEPRKPRLTTSAGPLKSQTSSNLQAKNKHLSSSDSSRNSSPAQGRKLQTAASRKIGTKSINMSLDSLASPSKRSNQLKSRLHTENEISVDSLVDSMRSSIITEKTISQESLKNDNGGNKRIISRSNPGINKMHLLHPNPVLTGPGKKPMALIQNSKLTKGSGSTSTTGYQNTSGSSPSSMTNKSSRLSSVSSIGNSPRDAFKNRSISVPGPTIGIKKSFLSAKSREILARKAANMEKAAKEAAVILQKDEKPNSIEIKNIIQPKTNGINKSVSSSNIPTRMRPNPPQTLQLKKKILMPQPIHHIVSTSKASQIKTSTVQKSNTLNANKNLTQDKSKGGKEVNKKLSKKSSTSDNKEQKIEIIVMDNNEELKDIRIESKLERSSTFCKESSDLPVSELQIIE